jgi:hypothetical protein
VLFDGALGDRELRGDLAIRESSLDEEGDLPLTSGKVGGRFLGW